MELEQFITQIKNLNLNSEEKLQFVYEYIRDQILFDFLPEIDDLSAQEVFRRGRGQCNNKTILFYKILKDLGFEAKVHFSTIDKRIHQGLFPAPLLFITPNEIGHSWIDVNINGKTIQLDGYINDLNLFNGAMKTNMKKKWDIGHSVALGSCGASLAFSLNGDNFVQMEGVKRDLGTTKDPRAWLNGRDNPNKVNLLKKIIYRIFLPVIRRRVEKVRSLGLT